MLCVLYVCVCVVCVLYVCVCIVCVVCVSVFVCVCNEKTIQYYLCST